MLRLLAPALLLTAPLLTGCDALLDEALDCAGEDAAEPLFTSEQEPDFEIVVPNDAPLAVGPFENGGKDYLQVWDCIPVSWWSSTNDQKVVQIYSDETECERYENVWVEHYECGDMDTPDAWFRDLDGDGLSSYDGDCDDDDPNVGLLDEDDDGVSDCADESGD